MFLNIDPKSKVSIWEQIVKKMKDLIIRNVLAPGEKLPSVRDLATLLVINPYTVMKAYEELEREGIIETVPGKGAYVCTKISPVKDEKRVLQLKIQLQQLIIEAASLGVKQVEFNHWVNHYFKSLPSDSEGME